MSALRARNSSRFPQLSDAVLLRSLLRRRLLRRRARRSSVRLPNEQAMSQQRNIDLAQNNAQLDLKHQICSLNDSVSLSHIENASLMQKVHSLTAHLTVANTKLLKASDLLKQAEELRLYATHVRAQALLWQKKAQQIANQYDQLKKLALNRMQSQLKELHHFKARSKIAEAALARAGYGLNLQAVNELVLAINVANCDQNLTNVQQNSLQNLSDQDRMQYMSHSTQNSQVESTPIAHKRSTSMSDINTNTNNIYLSPIGDNRSLTTNISKQNLNLSDEILSPVNTDFTHNSTTSSSSIYNNGQLYQDTTGFIQQQHHHRSVSSNNTGTCNNSNGYQHIYSMDFVNDALTQPQSNAHAVTLYTPHPSPYSQNCTRSRTTTDHHINHDFIPSLAIPTSMPVTASTFSMLSPPLPTSLQPISALLTPTTDYSATNINENSNFSSSISTSFSSTQVSTKSMDSSQQQQLKNQYLQNIKYQPSIQSSVSCSSSTSTTTTSTVTTPNVLVKSNHGPLSPITDNLTQFLPTQEQQHHYQQQQRITPSKSDSALHYSTYTASSNDNQSYMLSFSDEKNEHPDKQQQHDKSTMAHHHHLISTESTNITPVDSTSETYLDIMQNYNDNQYLSSNVLIHENSTELLITSSSPNLHQHLKKPTIDHAKTTTTNTTPPPPQLSPLSSLLSSTTSPDVTAYTD